MAFLSFFVSIITKLMPQSYIVLVLAIFLISSPFALTSQTTHILTKQIIKTDSIISDDVMQDLESVFILRENKKLLGVRWKLFAYNSINPTKFVKSLDRRASRGKAPGGYRYVVRELFGEPPVVWDDNVLSRTAIKMEQVMRQYGYLNADVEVTADSTRNRRVVATFEIAQGMRWHIDTVRWLGDFSGLPIDDLIRGCPINSGDPLSMQMLQLERSRLASKAQALGFATLNEGFIQYELDTSKSVGKVNIDIVLRGQKIEANSSIAPHLKINIGSVFFDQSEMKKPIHSDVLRYLVLLEEGGSFDPSLFEASYRRLSSVTAIKSLDIKKDFPISLSSEFGIVDVTVVLQSAPRYGLAIELDMTRADTRFGPLAKVTWTDKNTTKRADVLSWTASASIASTEPFSYNHNSIVPNSGEFGIQMVYRTIGASPLNINSLPKSTNAHSEWMVHASKESRPEYVRTTYNFNHSIDWVENKSKNSKIIFNPFRFSYVSLEKDEGFEEWLSDANDPLLSYRFSDYATTGSSLSWVQSIANGAGVNSLAVNVEWSGALSKPFAPLFGFNLLDDGGVYIGDVPIIKFLRLDGAWKAGGSVLGVEGRAWATKIRVGTAWVGDGTSALPYDRGFFGGGANGVRGWPVRELGPGNFNSESSEMVLLNGVGDVSLEMSAELRLVWSESITIAMFTDIGNVWLHDSDNNDGTSLMSGGIKSLALSTGVGLRYDFDFFLIRLDAALRIYDPSSFESERWIGQALPKGAIHLGLGHPF